MAKRTIKSTGDKPSVRRNGARVQLVWVDEAVGWQSGDTLLGPEDAVSLDDAVVLIGQEDEQGNVQS